MSEQKTKWSRSDRIFYVGTLGLVGLMILSGIVASSIKVNADDNDTTVSTASVTVAASCSMTANIETAHTATIPNGIYSGTSLYPNGIGKTNIATFCNDSGGYAIYAIGFTGDSYSGADHTKLIGQATNEKIATGTATGSNTGDPSNWAMKLVKEDDTTKSYNPNNLTITNGYGNYSAVPDTYTKVANYTSTTDATLGSVLSTTYAAYISGTQVADTYVGKVKYTLVHPNTEIPLQPQTTQSGKICYYPNGSAVEGTMGCQTIPASGTTDGVSPTSATLLASNFSRSGYGFAGWNTEFDYSGTFYGPNETISYTNGQYSGSNSGLSLYAVWVKSQGSLQDSSRVAQLCGTGTGSLTTTPIDGTVNLSSVSALTDQRDNDTYAIAKLSDGKCWMIENLRIEAEATRGDANKALAQGYGTSATYGNFIGLADPETADFLYLTDANSIYYFGTPSGTASIDIGTTNYPEQRMPRYNNLNTPDNASNRPQSPTSNTFVEDNTTVGMYSYGNYYTWAAAIADTTYYYSGDHGTTSICPTGWRLPQGNTTASGFLKLDIDMGGTGVEDQNRIAEASNRWRKFPNNFILSGCKAWNVHDRGGHGGYISSTAADGYDYYSFDITKSGIYFGLGEDDTRHYGNSIRCMLDS